MGDSQERVYSPRESVVFRKTTEEFGGLSNMAPGYPLRVAGITFLTSEALYQCCRFPHIPELQQLIISEKSPMTAKMRIKKYLGYSRSDWNSVRLKIMDWCLREKLAQNFQHFSALLKSSGERPIVEDSRKDSFWGALRQPDGTLVGTNALGRLLMQLRRELRSEPSAMETRPPAPDVGELVFLGRRMSDNSLAPTKRLADIETKGLIVIENLSFDGMRIELLARMISQLSAQNPTISASVHLSYEGQEAKRKIDGVLELLHLTPREASDNHEQPESNQLGSDSMPQRSLFIERRPQGDYAVRQAQTDQSFLFATNKEAVERARDVGRGSKTDLKRVRQSSREQSRLSNKG